MSQNFPKPEPPALARLQRLKPLVDPSQQAILTGYATGAVGIEATLYQLLASVRARYAGLEQVYEEAAEQRATLAREAKERIQNADLTQGPTYVDADRDGRPLVKADPEKETVPLALAGIAVAGALPAALVPTVVATVVPTVVPTLVPTVVPAPPAESEDQDDSVAGADTNPPAAATTGSAPAKAVVTGSTGTGPSETASADSSEGPSVGQPQGPAPGTQTDAALEHEHLSLAEEIERANQEENDGFTDPSPSD